MAVTFVSPVLAMFALAFLWFLAFTYDSTDAHYGAVIVALMAGFFALLGWIPANVIMYAVAIAVLGYLTVNHRTIFGTRGSGDTLFTISAFILGISLASAIVKDMGLFASSQFMASVNNTYTQQYNLETASTVFESIKDPTLIDVAIQGFGWLTKMISATIDLIWNMFTAMPGLVTAFGIPTPLANAIYAFYALLVVLALFKIIRSYMTPEI